MYLIYVRLNKNIGALDFEFGCYGNFILYTIKILHLLFEYIIFTVWAKIKTCDCHNITEILLKVALNTIAPKTCVGLYM